MRSRQKRIMLEMRWGVDKKESRWRFRRGKIYFLRRIKIRWDEELRWLVDWIFVFFGLLSLFFFVYSVHVRIYVLSSLFFCLQRAHQSFFFFRSVRIYVFSLLFWFTVCTSIIFFFYIVRIYVLSLLFLVYSVHINHFFTESIVRICILSLFFCLQRVHQSFFSSIRIYVLFFVFFTACTLKKDSM